MHSIMNRQIKMLLELSVSDYIARNVNVIDFSNPRCIQLPDVYQPQSCIIKFKHATNDIGSHCYRVRKLNKNGVATNAVKNRQGIHVLQVVTNSLDEKRLALIRAAIDWSSCRAKSASQVTLENELRLLLMFFSYYFEQSDLDYSDPKNRLHYEEAARRYSAVLRANNKVAPVGKSQRTRIVFSFAKFIYDEEELNAYDYNICAATGQGESCTTPLLAEDYELALALRLAIFDGVADILINNRKFPYRLTVPEACAELNNAIWLGYSPWRGTCRFPRNRDFEKRQPREWFDRIKGALFTKKQWWDSADYVSDRTARDTWYQIHKRLSATNQDHSNLKISLAEYAGMCFFDLILSITGMNQQPALDLPWYGGYLVQKSKQGYKTVMLLSHEDQTELEKGTTSISYLRSIKNRKGYQPVEVTISNRFLPEFKQYLQIRNYYLNGRTDARLFPFSIKLINNKRHALQQTFPEIPKLGAHKARAGISDSILTTTNDPHVAAQIMQNAPETLIKHYAAGTQKQHIQGVGGFFNALGNQIKVSRSTTENEIETAVGSCNNGGEHPDPLPDAPIEANCIQKEGCFFCKHYCVHADEIDIRKLASVLYYINKGATRAHDINFFNELFQLLLARIKALLEEIEALSKQKKELVTRIKEEVFTEELLDDYWLCKVNRLESLVGKN